MNHKSIKGAFPIKESTVTKLAAALEKLAVKTQKCPKCGTVGGHYCPADVARS